MLKLNRYTDFTDKLFYTHYIYRLNEAYKISKWRLDRKNKYKLMSR